MQINKFSKFYVSTKKENIKVYFQIDYEVRIYKLLNENTSISMRLKISYISLDKNKSFQNNECDRTNTWEFKTNVYNKSCDFCSSVRIHSEYRSFGIGSFVLNEIIKIANKYTPSASLSGFLSPVDEGEDNKERRNSLYRNIGFIIEHDRFYIEKISDLHLDRKLEYIQTLNYSNMFDLLSTLQDKKINLEYDLKNRTTMYKEIYKEKNKYHKKVKYAIIFIIFLLIFGIFIILTYI